MSLMVANGLFDPATESVDVIGDFNQWGTTLTTLSDPDQDQVYSVTNEGMPIGVPFSYKFRLNGISDQREEFAGTQQVRRFIPQDAGNVVWHQYQNADAAPLKADFAVSSTSLKAGNSISFSNLSEGNPQQFAWEFEGGNPATSSEENPEVTYAAPGRYNVSLTVSKNGLSDTLLREELIVVTTDADPSMTVTPFPFSATTPITLTVDVSGNAQLEALTEAWLWAWVPNVGDAPTNVNPANAAADAAKFTKLAGNLWELSFTPSVFLGFPASQITSVGFILKGRDWSNGQTENFVFNVQSGSQLVAAFSANPTTLSANGQVQFTDQSVGGPTSWQWNFGDGTVSTQQNPVHVYQSVGAYDVSLTVSNGAGTDTESKTAYIQVTAVTGLADDAFLQAIRLYPNPAQEKLHLAIEAPFSGPFTATLLSVSGKELQHWHFEKKQFAFDAEIPLPVMPSGIYFLRIGTSEASTVKRFLVK